MSKQPDFDAMLAEAFKPKRVEHDYLAEGFSASEWAKYLDVNRCTFTLRVNQNPEAWVVSDGCRRGSCRVYKLAACWNDEAVAKVLAKIGGE